MMKRYLVLLPVVLLLFACSDDEQAAGLTSGKALFEHYCVSCHKATGDGSFLRGVPAIKSTTLSNSEIVTHILGHERPEDSRMPTFDHLSRSQAEAIAVYLRRDL